MGISVRMANMPYTGYMTIAGMQMAFDFSDDVSEGESILAYTVGLSFFQVRYATDSSEASEQVGQVGVTMIPNQIGNVIYYTPNLMFTDFDGSGGSEPQDCSGRNSYVWATCVAYIGTSLSDYTAVLCTAYDQTSSSSSPITISSDEPSNYCFIAGFDVYASPMGQSQQISELTISANSNPSTGSITVNGGISMTSSASSAGTVDIGLISTSGIDNFAIVEPTVSLGSTNGESGQEAYISYDFTIPEGYSKISNAGLLINNVSMSLSKEDYVQEIEFGLLTGGLIISDSTVSGTIAVNMWNDRDSNKYLDSGSIVVYLIAQFA
jgi:hypothetical protein